MIKVREQAVKAAALVLLGILINIAGAKLALLLGVPLYLDSIGTVLAAAIGGYLPGIVVGFLSNAINSIDDTITLYYGIISVLIAIMTAHFASRGGFGSYGKSLTIVPLLTVLGGGLGSVLTWMLYGFNIGEGISAKLAEWFWETAGFQKFFAQLAADMLIDFPDKLVTVTAVYLILRLIPEKSRNWFVVPGVYGMRFGKGKSLSSKVISIVLVSGILIGAVSISVSTVIYNKVCRSQYAQTALGVAKMTANEVPPRLVDLYLATNTQDGRYEAIMKRLEYIKASFSEVKFIYIYRIEEDGCHVVFDVDSEDFEGSPLGSVMEFEESFLPYLDELLAGKEIEPVVSNDQFGHLMTIYYPIQDEDGNTAAYACVDIMMDELRANEAEYSVRLVSLIFASLIVLCIAAIAYAEKKMVEPINLVTEAAAEFAYDSEEQRILAKQRFAELDIHTGDEIERLYDAANKTFSDVADYITYANEQSKKISDMQFSIIAMLADIVEQRDENTGEHIKRTAAYVGIIAKELEKTGKYPEITGDYVYDMQVAAPLHDVGKIQISDTLINKPGKLTPEEFEVMKTHAAAGREMMENAIARFGSFSYLSMASDMAGSHHEWWNGKGYPEGISGDEIPLCARIMAVADVFDALISKRSYKDAMSIDKAYQILIEESGTHFDPDCVAAFVAAREEVEKVST